MGTLLWQPRFGSSFGFHEHWRPQMTAISDGCKLEDSLYLFPGNDINEI